MGQWKLGSGTQKRDWDWRTKINSQVRKWYFKPVKLDGISQGGNLAWERKISIRPMEDNDPLGLVEGEKPERKLEKDSFSIGE